MDLTNNAEGCCSMMDLRRLVAWTADRRPYTHAKLAEATTGWEPSKDGDSHSTCTRLRSRNRQDIAVIQHSIDQSRNTRRDRRSSTLLC